MHIVMGTGIYHDGHHPPSIASLDASEIAEMLVRDITEGVDGTGVRAGIIGEQGTFTGPMTEREKVVFRASAMAAMETGVAVTTHTHLGLNALDQIDVLTSVGLAPERIVIGHLDDGEPDLDLIREIIRRGAWAQFDDIGYEYYTERLKVQMTTDVVRAAKAAPAGGGGPGRPGDPRQRLRNAAAPAGPWWTGSGGVGGRVPPDGSGRRSPRRGARPVHDHQPGNRSDHAVKLTPTSPTGRLRAACRPNGTFDGAGRTAGSPRSG